MEQKHLDFHDLEKDYGFGFRFNTDNGIDPTPLRKKIGDITEMLAREEADTEQTLKKVAKAPTPSGARASLADRPSEELTQLIEDLSAQMRSAAGDLQFELAARLRDEIGELKKELRQMLGAQ